MSTDLNIASAERSMQICNACRYCESLCAVFPAMASMRDFDQGRLDYLANLCHQCGACVDACQYAPPHPFAVDVRRAFSDQRAESYARTSLSPALWRIVARRGASFGLLSGALFSLIMLLSVWIDSPAGVVTTGGDFYAVMPHTVMVWLGGITFFFGVAGVSVSALRFRRRLPPAARERHGLGAALHDAASLKYLGDSLCHQEQGELKGWQRRLHHATTIGLLLCFLATTVGTVYHYLFGWIAPYPWYSVPGVTGTLGGALMLAGTSGLAGLKMMTPVTDGVRVRAMDVSLIMTLWMVALTGLLLRFFGDTPALAVLLMIHLGFVFAFFVSLPFSKMIHAPLRVVALRHYHRTQPRD